MLASLKPSAVNPGRGKVLVEITEILGGTRKSGLFIPGTTQDHMGKDTAKGIVLKLGKMPIGYHKMTEGRNPVPTFDDGTEWPNEVCPLNQGDVILFSRDVPVAWAYEDKRYAIVLVHELIAKFPTDLDIEVVPRSA